MSFVYGAFLFFSVAAFVLDKAKGLKFTNPFFLFYLFASLLFIMGLRSEYVGADSVQYFLSFRELNQMGLSDAFATRYAAGYILLVRTIGLFTLSPYVFFFVVSLLTLTIYFWFLKKYSVNVFFSLIVFFCLYWTDFLVLTRQACASCVVCLGIPFLLADKKKTFSLFVLIAMQFHSSAIITFVLIPVLKLNLTPWKIVGFIGGAFIVAKVALPLLWNLISIVNVGSYAQYIDTKFNSAGTSMVVDLIIKVAPSLICFLFGYIGSKNERIQVQNLFLSMNLFGICFIIIGMESLIFQRLSLYFNVGTVVCCSYLFASRAIKKTTRHFLVWGLIVFSISIFTVIQIERPNWMRITPYSFCWSPVNFWGSSEVQYFW